MVKISISYDGELHCTAVHEPSQTRIRTDAPVDHGGKGQYFSPTDLVAAAVGTCMATVMGIYAQKHAIELKGMTLEVTKEMTTTPPRRIARIVVHILMPADLDDRQKKAMENAAHQCPVHKSLHPDIEVPVIFEYPKDGDFRSS